MPNFPDLDRNGLEYLDRSECLALLRQQTFGRVGLTIGALPTILPVTYRLVGERVVFRTGSGSKLAAATSGTVVAFEVDAMDPLAHTGWSVVVTGIAQVVYDSAELAELEKLGIPRWAPTSNDRTVALETDLISGRRLTQTTNRNVVRCEHPLLRDEISCPRCGSRTFESVSDGDMTNFRCVECKHCWHWELNHISEVDPTTCPGCSHLQECLAAASASRLSESN